MKIADDKRYSINKEWCGQSQQMYVVRFCGEWIGKGSNKHDAGMVALAHSWKRQDALQRAEYTPHTKGNEMGKNVNDWEANFDAVYSEYVDELGAMALMNSGITVDRKAYAEAEKEATKRMVQKLIS